MPRNLLDLETSPYLLQHKDNPVHWHPWNDDALGRARRENKPILLSIGYAACHWCHVMAHESFENEAIAAVMNEHFVNIKVDREERPDLDVIYQTALALLGQQGGWPLTMFLTPEGEPFWGGTYFPPTARYGRPGFPELLHGIADTYRTQADKVQQNVVALRDAMVKLGQPAGGDGLTMDLIDRAATIALRMVDPHRGGTSGAPKFPQPTFFKFLWRAYRRSGSSLFGEAVRVTLDAMCQGGIYDHLGGGFARYSTDEDWLVPHFEKMLYDNALLIELLTEVWQETGSVLYETRVAETIDWALAEMTVGDGEGYAFASALDADSEGEEGRFYVWDEAEIDSVLGTDSPTFKAAYDVMAHGNWEGHTILNRRRAPTLGAPAVESKLAECRGRLKEVRDGRVRPQRDDKVLADWNGMMIAALAAAGAAFDRPQWITTAADAFAFVCRTMTAEGRLRHSWCAGQARHPAVIDDYAQMARAALLLYEATADAAYLHQAESWVATADARHWDGDAGGYYLSADDTTDVITRSKTVADNAVPPGNGVMVEVLVRLHCLTGEEAYRQRAEDLVRVFSAQSPEHLINMPSLLNGFELLDGPVQIVVVGTRDDDRTQPLERAVHEASLPRRILVHLAPGTDLPAGHPAHGKDMVDGAPTAYVCVGATCRLPVTDPETLRRELQLL